MSFIVRARPRWLRLASGDVAPLGEHMEAMLRTLGDSPMEDLFLLALDMQLRAGATVNVDHRGVTSYFGTTNTLRVERQAAVGPYSADVLLTLMVLEAEVSRVAVEVDGHDFHEKTKGQAEHDKRRDRFFALQGLTTFRFTGSEVYRDAPGCVAETLELLNRQASLQAKIAERVLWLRARVERLATLTALDAESKSMRRRSKVTS